MSAVVPLYPPRVFPTADMTSIFDPLRTHAWRRPLAPRASPQILPPASPVTAAAPSPQPQPQRAVASHAPPMAVSSAPIVPLTVAQANAIQTMINARPDDHPYVLRGSTRFGSLFKGFVSAVDPRDVTLRWLTERHVTLRELLSYEPLKLPVTDLYRAGIVRSFGDLLALDFQSTDLTLRREHFNTGHFVQLFAGGANGYALLRDTIACGGFSLTTLMRAVPSFTCADLLDLGVSASDLLLMPDGAPSPSFDFKTLSFVGLSMEDWAALGLTSEHFALYKVTADSLARKLQWDPRQAARHFGLPPEWLTGTPLRL